MIYCFVYTVVSNHYYLSLDYIIIICRKPLFLNNIHIKKGICILITGLSGLRNSLSTHSDLRPSADPLLENSL